MQRRRQDLVQSEAYQFSRAAQWPVSSCLISEDWAQPQVLIQIILTRGRPDAPPGRNLAVGVYLVDPACLGLKNTYGGMMDAQQRREMLEHIGMTAALCEIEPGVAVGIIRAAIAYAEALGFPPQADFRETQALLAGVPPADVSGRLRLGGENGKPFYITGPEDDAEAILRRLTAKLGPDGFDYAVGG
jgi:hypothetical protein